jgi:hypothetical protein
MQILFSGIPPVANFFQRKETSGKCFPIFPCALLRIGSFSSSSDVLRASLVWQIRAINQYLMLIELSDDPHPLNFSWGLLGYFGYDPQFDHASGLSLDHSIFWHSMFRRSFVFHVIVHISWRCISTGH